MFTANTTFGIVLPRIQAAYVGDSVIILCFSKGPLLWMTEDGKVLARHTGSDNNLALHNVKVKDSGSYVCHGTYENGQMFKAKSRLLVGGD